MQSGDVVPNVSIEAGAPKETLKRWLKVTFRDGPKFVRIYYPPLTDTDKIERHLRSMRAVLANARSEAKRRQERPMPFKMLNEGIGRDEKGPYLDLRKVNPDKAHLHRVKSIMEGLELWE